MTVEEIRDISIDSADVYYEYLKQNGKGIQEVDVAEIEYLQSYAALIKLRINAKLFDIETIAFKNLRNNKSYDASEIKIIEYDNDKNILLIRPTKDSVEAFSNLKTSDLKLISDLKFLVQRVKTWYELNGAKLALPAKASKYADDFRNIEFFQGLEPSDNQKKSLENIFTNPFAYVWGAPGTGKTQFVLSYAVLHYIKKGSKIAILAPTNNAIEQVLSGVIKMTDKAGVDRKRILRLGVPLKKFAEKYPEVCEEQGIQKKIHEIDKQISILERIQAYRSTQKFAEQATSAIEQFDKIENSYGKHRKEKRREIDSVNTDYKKKEIEAELFQEEVAKCSRQLENYSLSVNSFSNRVIKLFTSKPTPLEKTIAEVKNEIFNLKKELEFSKFQLSELGKKRDELQAEIATLDNTQGKYIQNFKSQFEARKELYGMVKKLSASNYGEVKGKISKSIAAIKKQLEVDRHLLPEYESASLLSIDEELRSYKEVRAKLAATSTEERLKTVNVVACTLDGYIGRYADAMLNVEHIFLDEAGYANMVKALTLFNHSVPISFLGDHMQLPPVCEINDRDIERDDKYANMFLWAQSAIFLDTLFVSEKNACKYAYLKNLPLKPGAITKTSLNSTFRFGDSLAKILAGYVYDGDFKSSALGGKTKILYAHAAKKEALYSRTSMEEAEKIQDIVNALKQSLNEDFVVLTPYKKQLKLLGNRLPQERNDLKILTVHASQGREWDTVILSVVDTADKWFVDTAHPISKGLNLVNTAVSRAKKRLIIVCDTAYWLNQSGQLLTDLLKNGENIGQIHSFSSCKT
ncbi:MAG: ATP-binding domain-containing protein [Prevotellaceae bacterium]|jgi:hypothetical protein|nr:ATP-binding domain-containing protein [Prevotellaceae bacterium]